MRLVGHVLAEGRRPVPFVQVEGTTIRNMRRTPEGSSTGRIDCGREWGNPYRIDRDGTRSEVIAP